MVKVEKSQIRVSIPVYVASQLDIVFRDRRLNSRSELITEYCKDGLANEDIIPLPVRVANAKDVIGSKLDSILSTKNILVGGSIVQKFDVAFMSWYGFGGSEGVLIAKNSFESALFMLIEDVKELDIEEYKVIMGLLTKYTPLKRRYTKYTIILTGQVTL